MVAWCGGGVEQHLHTETLCWICKYSHQEKTMLYNIIFPVLCFVVIASHPYSSATAQAPGVSTVKNSSESVPPQGQRQNCPGEPLACSYQSCGGQSGGLSKCATADPVLHGCQCCPDRTPDCESPECDGDPQQRRCKAELLHNCKCIIIPSADVDLIVTKIST